MSVLGKWRVIETPEHDMAGANSYIQKPAEYPSYRDLVMTLRQYWHETALRAPRHRPRS